MKHELCGLLAWFPDRPVSDESPVKIYRDTLISRATRDATRGTSTRGTHTRDGTRSTGGGLLDRLVGRGTRDTAEPLLHDGLTEGRRSTGGGLLDRLTDTLRSDRRDREPHAPPPYQLDRSTQPAETANASEGARDGATGRSVAKSLWLSTLRNVGLSSVLLIFSVSWSTGV